MTLAIMERRETRFVEAAYFSLGWLTGRYSLAHLDQIRRDAYILFPGYTNRSRRNAHALFRYIKAQIDEEIDCNDPATIALYWRLQMEDDESVDLELNSILRYNRRYRSVQPTLQDILGLDEGTTDDETNYLA